MCRSWAGCQRIVAMTGSTAADAAASQFWTNSTFELVLVGVMAFGLGVWLGTSRRQWAFALRLTGYAYAMGSGIVILVGMMILLLWPGNAVTFSIGTSISATGIASLFMYFYAANQQGQISRLELFSRFGLDQAFDGRGPAIRVEYDSRLSSARRYIDVLGFGMSALLEDHFEDFAIWKESAHVRILLLDPDFPSRDHSVASLRDVEERSSPGKIARDVTTFVERTRHLVGRTERGSFTVRLYSCIPAVNIFRIDNALFWGPYLIKSASRNAPTIEVREGGLFFARLIGHFENIWTDDSLSRVA
jgi:hypothetical protein